MLQKPFIFLYIKCQNNTSPPVIKHGLLEAFHHLWPIFPLSALKSPGHGDFPATFDDTPPGKSVESPQPTRRVHVFRLHPLGVIRDYDAKKGFGFIRCQGLSEERGFWLAWGLRMAILWVIHGWQSSCFKDDELLHYPLVNKHRP